MDCVCWAPWAKATLSDRVRTRTRNRSATRLDTEEGGAGMRPALVHPRMRTGAGISACRIGPSLSVDGSDNVHQTGLVGG
jgi:hypothetical protein